MLDGKLAKPVNPFHNASLRRFETSASLPVSIRLCASCFRLARATCPVRLVKKNVLILALDIGTSSLRSALFNERGQRIERTTAQKEYALSMREPGAAELAVADFERAAVRAIRETLKIKQQTRELKDRPIAAVGTSCFWHGLIGYDLRRKRPTPIYTWEDSRCREEADRLRQEMNEAAYHRRTGCMLRTSYWPAKLRWVRRMKQDSPGNLWLSPGDWLYARLAGSFTTSLSMASGTGLLDLHHGKWDAALLRRLPLQENWLAVISDEPLHVDQVGSSVPPLHRFPELKDAAWYPALGDGAASNLGSDATTSNVAAMNVGTSAALRLTVPTPPSRLPTGLFCYRIDAQTCLVGGAISNAGNLRAWAIKELRLPEDPPAIERAMARRTSPAPGLIILPFWAAERFPSWPAGLGGTITGLTYGTTALDLLQASVESTYQRLAQIADLLEQQRGSQFHIVVSGGIRRSPESLQRLANVLGRTVRPCAEPEASLRGAAVYALKRLGGKVEKLPLLPAVHAHPKSARQYREAREAQVDLEKRMGNVKAEGSPLRLASAKILE